MVKLLLLYVSVDISVSQMFSSLKTVLDLNSKIPYQLSSKEMPVFLFCSLNTISV